MPFTISILQLRSHRPNYPTSKGKNPEPVFSFFNLRETRQ